MQLNVVIDFCNWILLKIFLFSVETFACIMPYFGRKLGTGYVVLFKVLNYLWDCLLDFTYCFQA